MSLKDRLNTAQKQTQTQVILKEQKEQPKYYSSEKEALSDNLGIIDTLLADDDINGIFVSGAKNISIDKKGKIRKNTSTFRDNVQLINMLKKIALNEGIALDEKNPFFEFNYDLGINAIATIPPLSNVASLYIKCYKDKHATMQILQEELSVSKEIALILEAFCSIKKNILIIGETNTLKTTLLSALAKKIPSNNRAIIIDSENEFIINGQNYTNYNFSKIDENIKEILLTSIVNSLPDKVIINSKDEALYAKTIQKAQNHRGIITTLNTNNAQNAMDKTILILQKNIPNLTQEKARTLFLGAFDIIITTTKDELGRRKISAISEINLLSQHGIIQEIFTLDYALQHKSCGITPIFYDDIKTNSLPISDGIFDINYKHTYCKNIESDSEIQFSKKSANIDILRKFKKNLPTQEEIQEENQEATQQEIQDDTQNKTSIELNEQELSQRVQEKFNELKNNIQLNKEFEINLQDIENNNEAKDENI